MTSSQNLTIQSTPSNIGIPVSSQDTTALRTSLPTKNSKKTVNTKNSPWKKKKMGKRTYNTRDSLVVTDPTTNLALTSLTKGERTGSRTFSRIWSYVLDR